MAPEHAEEFIKNGEVLFRSLSFFRDYEDDGVRSDQYEGTRVHRPENGLKITNVTTGEELTLPHTFQSTAKENDIFVCCFSSELSETIAKRFNSASCVEIIDSPKFISMLRAALVRRPSIKNKTLVYGAVKYYALNHPPIIDWALPERIALSKPESFSWQNEYRIAFAKNNAFAVENVEVNLVPLGMRAKTNVTAHAQYKLKLGKLGKVCKIHSF